MKVLQYKKQLSLIPHIIFWFVSFNFWYVILNPGVESTGVIQDLGVGWDLILRINSILLIYCTLPFIWFVKKAKLWLKIIPSVLFLIPIGYAILQGLLPDGDKKEVADTFEFVVKNFLYVVFFHLTIVFAVYYNLRVLIVRFLNKSRFKLYLASFFGLCVLASIINFVSFNYFVDKLFPSLYFISYLRIWELALIMLGYVAFTGILFLIGQYAQMLIEKREAAQNELASLKAQINPHFLFNNLNTIYSLASQNDSRTTDVILKLSDFLRYVLYDTSNERIPLEKEVEMIKAYVGLQKERINPEITTIELETSGDFSGVKIAPLLLLPLAENCFKHGVGKDLGYIHIFIGYDNQQLVFSTENNVALREKTESNENGGIGIQNVEKRLSLIYPDRHSLQYQEKDGIYRLEMKIDLKS